MKLFDKSLEGLVAFPNDTHPSDAVEPDKHDVSRVPYPLSLLQVFFLVAADEAFAVTCNVPFRGVLPDASSVLLVYYTVHSSVWLAVVVCMARQLRPSMDGRHDYMSCLWPSLRSFAELLLRQPPLPPHDSAPRVLS